MGSDEFDCCDIVHVKVGFIALQKNKGLTNKFDQCVLFTLLASLFNCSAISHIPKYLKMY